jgi:uncharacterized membrane protein YdbT with pleckstrin-like domain
MLARVVAFTLLALFVAGVVSGNVSSGATRLVWLGALGSVAWLVWRLLDWNVNVFIVTNQRLMLMTGLTTRRVAMQPLRRVHDLTYKRSPFGRLLGYGEFLIESAGESQGLRRITYVPDPDAVYLQISELLFGRAPLRTINMADTPPTGVPPALEPDIE